MQSQFEKYCSLVFKEIKKELSDEEFQNVQRVIGIWPLPNDWRTPDSKSGYLMFPEKGICVIEAPFKGYGNFKISISIKMGEVRLGFIFPVQFWDLLEACTSEIEHFILREYSTNEGRNKKTMTNFASTPSGQKIIDFIYYDQFADMMAMEQAMHKNDQVAQALAKSIALTLSHLYCSITSQLVIEQQTPHDGIIDETESANDFINSQRIYILIDPNSELSKDLLIQKIEDLNGRFVSLYEMHEDSKILVVSWPTINMESIISAEKELRSFAYRNKSEIHLYEHFGEPIDAIPVSEED